MTSFSIALFDGRREVECAEGFPTFDSALREALRRSRQPHGSVRVYATADGGTRELVALCQLGEIADKDGGPPRELMAKGLVPPDLLGFLRPA